MNKVLKILGYIFLFIVLIPVLIVGLYVALGASLFLILYFYNRKKNGPSDPKSGKSYKTLSSIILIIGLFILYFNNQLSFFSFKGYLFIQIITFISLLPICYYQFKLIKNKA